MKTANRLRYASQLRCLAVLLVALCLRSLAPGQIQLVSGYNFGQFLGAGAAAIDGDTFEDDGFIGANWKHESPPPGISSGDNTPTEPYSNGSGTLFWNGTAGSSSLLGSDNVVAYNNPSFSFNFETVTDANMSLLGDHAGTNMALDVKGAFSVGFRQAMTGYSDPGGTDLTFAAQASTAPITIDWLFNSEVVATTNVGTSWAVYTVDLPEGFYGSLSDLTAAFSGAGRLDNVQFNGFLGDPPASALTFWKGGDGLWTAATTPTNWREAVDGVEEGVWDGGEATFGGTAGTVTVDDADGAIEFTGIKFLVDGYAVTGDALTTTTASAPVQVGDGTGSTTTATIASVITGTGGMNKTDLGTLVLSGANTYAGTTTVSRGTLRINGDQSAATGAVVVASGGTLTGSGITGGAVTVQGGAALAGQTGTVFTVAGLTLDPGSNLSVTLGAPDTTRLFQVNGNLTLDGALNVNNTPGFGNGTYRLIDYTGALTDNGLSIGGVPGSASDFAVQTSIANQVNLLVNVSSLFWAGGDGSWTTTPGTGWTNIGGTAFNWTPNYAIFQGTAGTVTVDTSGGAVLFTGAQFSTNGYTIAGGPLTTNTADTSVRVGDGTSAGAALTATISANIDGSGGITKRDFGTLVITGAAIHTGGTTVSDGTLQIGAGGTAGSIAGAITNNATLAFNRSDAVTHAGVISGTGTVVKEGANTLSLTAANTYTGGTTIKEGTLQIGAGGTTGSVTGNITNDGAVAFNRSNALTYAGAISGSGAVVKLGTGTTTLTGASTHTGGTTVSEGILSIGAGGTTGSLTGDITNEATLAFNRSNALTYAGVISGSGAVLKQGAGTTTFTGDNTYTGDTMVEAGKLLITGDQSEATGLITVADGATLGGTGVHGGDVVIEDGGILSGATGSKFTMGNLTLNAESNVNITLGAPGTNELFKVNGDLTLDGLLNITTGTGLAEGLTRLFSFTGTLTDNTLAIGSVAGNATAYTIQTATANQVNLLYAAAPVAWAGGSGTWSSGTSGGGWGDTNGTWTPGFALFGGDPGSVAIASTTANPISITGIQFMVDGYEITGTGSNALTPTKTNTAFRVGDGTPDGAGMTAVISAPIAGTGGVDKTDLGTLVLTSTTSSYTGGTRVSGGVLQVADDRSLGATAGAVRLNGGTLRAGANLTSARSVIVSATGSTVDTGANSVTLSGVISGTGGLTKNGVGTLTVSGNNTHTGETIINQGAIALAGAGSLGATTVAAGARLSGTGRIRGNLTNNGSLSPGASPGTVTVVGNYTQSATGLYAVEIASASSYDKLVVSGTANLGGTLSVSYLGGFIPGPDQTFKVLESDVGVNGTFAAVVAPSAAVSAMRKFSVTYNPRDVTVGYLQLPFAGLEGSANQVALGGAIDAALAAKTIPTLGAVLNAMATEAQVTQAMAELSPQRYENWFHQAVHNATGLVRTAESRLAPKDSEAKADHPGGAWFEVQKRTAKFNGAGESRPAEASTDGIVIGADMAGTPNLNLGVMFGYSDEQLRLDQVGSNTDVQRISAAAYVRYEAIRGFIEAVGGASYNKHDSRRVVDIPGIGGMAEGSADGSDTFASVRAGFHVHLGKTMLTPYLAFQHTRWQSDELVESGLGDASLTINEQNATSLASRVGLSAALPIKAKNMTLTPRIDVAWRFEFRDDPRLLSARLGEQEFSILTKAPAANGFIGTFGFDATFGAGTTAYARVTTERDTTADESYDARAGVDFRF